MPPPQLDKINVLKYRDVVRVLTSFQMKVKYTRKRKDKREVTVTDEEGPIQDSPKQSSCVNYTLRCTHLTRFI